MASPQNRQEDPIQKIFDRIAHRYDLLNRVISLRLDTYWRKKAVQAALRRDDRVLLDLGTGTGDLALTAAREIKDDGTIVGLDFSFEMLKLAVAKKKKTAAGKSIRYVHGSALAPPFREQNFDVVMTSFVLRNIPELDLFFLQAFRLLKPGGRLLSLEMFPPSTGLFAFFYGLYFYRLVPSLGAILARDRKAYRHLSETVRTFDQPEAIAELIRHAGFDAITIHKWFRGAVCLHLAEKPPSYRDVNCDA